ncbi:5-amino-6-(5-phospho-D-ribitylamino)uracil phosphatase YigB [Vibrio makurazakiensis]|uniref:5-amino-6-(5-phospho-D-ribitylamino)uracil phosphatase YigB n=1 Tax=Vibrio makurazakiensis TaxID=2910250 RepID=UPI003D0F8577
MHFYRSPRPIKAMTFDLDDTLYDNWPVIARVEKKMAEWLFQHHPVSSSISLQEWAQVKQKVAKLNPDLMHDVTAWRHAQIKTGLIELGYTEPQAEQAAVDGIQRALFLRNQVDVPAESLRVLAELGKKIPLIAITNGNVDPNKIGLGEYFQLILKAGPDGRAKPYPDMFVQAQQHLNVEADEILHVGDHLITDVQGAKQNGFQACWFNDGKLNLFQQPKARVLPDLEIHLISELLEIL